MRRGLPLAAALLAAAVCARANPSAADERTAREEFLSGVEAHLKGDDADAAEDWARCLRLAAKGGRDESDCRLFSDMLRERLAPKAPSPDENGDARRAYVEGRDDYLRGAFAGAGRRWHECLTASDRDPASRPDCLMALELVFARRLQSSAPEPDEAAVEKRAPEPEPAPSDAASAQQAYLEGVIFYQKGDYSNARKRWTSCAALDSDCRAGLGKLDELFAPREPAPSAAARTAQQAYLEGVIDYQKGDYAKARERWAACAERNADCRAGLERLEKLWGFSTAPDGKK